PRIARDSAGNLHVIFYREHFDPISGVNEHAIHYAKNPQSGGLFAPLVGNVSPLDYPEFQARIAVLSSSDAQIVWQHAGGQVLTKRQTGGVWGTNVTVAVDAKDPDMAIDSSDAAHFVYIAGAVTYKKTAAGPAETVSEATSALTAEQARIVVDSRTQ